MASKTSAKIIIGIGLILFVTGVVMGRYFPLLYPQLAFVIRNCSIGAFVVGFINLWQVRHSAKKSASKS